MKTVIKAAQPFETSLTPLVSHRHALRRLHMLDIRDKHQTLNVVTANMDVIGWAVPEGTGATKHRVFPVFLELNTPQPMLLIEFATLVDFDVSVYPSADFQVVLIDEEAGGWPPMELVAELAWFSNAVSYVTYFVNLAYETGEPPFVPIEPSANEST